MSHISNEKWAELKERMQLLGIYEQDLSEHISQKLTNS